jgi:hypothetical protein
VARGVYKEITFLTPYRVIIDCNEIILDNVSDDTSSHMTTLSRNEDPIVASCFLPSSTRLMKVVDAAPVDDVDVICQQVKVHCRRTTVQLDAAQ